MICDDCLYNKNCQFLAKTKVKDIGDCSVYTTLEEYYKDIKEKTTKLTAWEILNPLLVLEVSLDPLKTGIRYATLKEFCDRFGIEVQE